GGQAGVRPAEPGHHRVRGRAGGRRRPALRPLVDAAPAGDQFLRPRVGIPVPAVQGQLDRGRDLGDPAQHRGRAGPRAAARDPGGQGRSVEGPAAMSQATEAARAGAASDGTPSGGPAAAPDLLYTEQESDLRAAVRALLEDRAGWRDVLARTETADTCDTGLWQTLAAQVGCAGLLVPEDRGGAGASYREAAVVAEELGRHTAPVPFLGSAVIATTALLSARDDELLAQVASGAVTAALAVPFAAGAAGPQVNLLPRPTVRVTGPAPGDEPGTHRLTGTITGVADALTADVLLVPADGVPYALYAVRAADAGLSKAPVVSLDMTRQLCDLSLEGASARRVAADGGAAQAVVRALVAGAGIIASEQLGLAERCLEMTVAYVKERRQFSRPVGS